MILLMLHHYHPQRPQILLQYPIYNFVHFIFHSIYLLVPFVLLLLVSKWNENSDERSYKFDIAGVSAVFGDGSDGALTISSNTTQAPVDSACTGTAAAYALTATNASFATGDKILIHQSRGTGAGKWERNEIASYTAGTITCANQLINTYVSGAQVIVLKEYTNVTINTGITCAPD